MSRNMIRIKKEFSSTLIDGLILTSSNALVFGYLFPSMGMNSALVAPVFVGTLVTMIFNLGFSLAARVVVDLEHNRFIDYQITLPLGSWGVLCSYIASFFIELIISISPLIVFGMMALSEALKWGNVNWLWFIPIYSISLLFVSVFFLALGLRYQYYWFFDNVWPRRLTPLVISGCIFIPWTTIARFSPLIGFVSLLNPVTYISEGLRSSLLGGTAYIAPQWCLLGVMIWLAFSLIFLAQSKNKQITMV